MSSKTVHPLEIVYHQASGQLAVQWSDGLHVRLESHVLRSACRCAACVKQRRAGTGPTPRSDARLTDLLPVGEFGLQLCFDDGHERGIYPWPFLHELSLALKPGPSP